MSETVDVAVLRAWMAEREIQAGNTYAREKADMLDHIVKLLIDTQVHQGGRNALEDVTAMVEERKAMRWRMAELQRLVDEGYDVAGDKRVLRASRQVLHFILTGRLSE